MHKIHSLKSDRNVKMAGSDRVYFYTINLGQKCENHRVMDFSFHCYGVQQISIQESLSDLSLDNKASACLSLVPVLRISAVLKMLSQRCHLYTPNTDAASRSHTSALQVHTASYPKTAIFIHQHHCKNPRSQYCTFSPIFMPTLLGTHFTLILQEHV